MSSRAAPEGPMPSNWMRVVSWDMAMSRDAGEAMLEAVGLPNTGRGCAALAAFAVVPAVWMLLPLPILGGLGNGHAGACFSTLLVSRTPDSARGRVSAAVNAAVGGAQGVSLLI